MFITLDQLKRSLVATKEYISTVKNQLQAAIPTKVSQLQNDSGYSTTPDWNQNASSASDFIKNRICYIEDPADVTILDIIISGNDTELYLHAGFDASMIDFGYGNQAQNYQAQFGEDTYSGYVYKYNNYWSFGNQHLVNQFDTDTGEPFFCTIEDSLHVILKESNNGTHFSVQILNYPIAHTINERYLDGALLQRGNGSRGMIINAGSANGDWSVAESHGEASGSYSHAESYSTASGYCSHAECGGEASGSHSHAEGLGSLATHAMQHVFGSYNIQDPSTADADSKGTYIEIVGNGTEQASSNARTLDWSGNEVLAGKLTVGAAPTANMDVATKKYVDDAVSGGSAGSAVTYTLSMTNNIITLTGSDGSTSSVTLPVYDGAFSVVGEGASF